MKLSGLKSKGLSGKDAVPSVCPTCLKPSESRFTINTVDACVFPSKCKFGVYGTFSW